MESPVRAITVTGQNLVFEGEIAEQPSLFEDGKEVLRREREERLAGAIDEIRRRFGGDAVLYGSSTRRDILAGHEKTEPKAGKNHDSHQPKSSKNG